MRRAWCPQRWARSSSALATWRPRSRAANLAGQPAIGGEEAAQPLVVGRQGRQPGAEEGALPPGARGIAEGGELVPVELGADVAGRRVRERVGVQEAQGSRIVVKQLPDKMQRPWITVRAGHGGKPDLPIQAVVIGRDHARPAMEVARLTF